MPLYESRSCLNSLRSKDTKANSVPMWMQSFGQGYTHSSQNMHFW